MKGRRLAARRPPRLETDSENAEPFVMSGKSAPLHKYLDDRFADSVVLTFAEIEDLIGFALPEPARLRTEWWTSPAPDASSFADAWILANRTAVPNMQARIVVFDRS